MLKTGQSFSLLGVLYTFMGTGRIKTRCLEEIKMSSVSQPEKSEFLGRRGTTNNRCQSGVREELFRLLWHLLKSWLLGSSARYWQW